MRQLRIMHVLPGLGMGGMEKFAVDLLKGFDAKDICSMVCCLEGGYFSDALKQSGVEVFVLEKKSKFHEIAFYKALSSLFKKEKVDIVHSWSGMYRDAIIPSKLANVPINIHTDQGKFYPDTKRSRFNHWLFSHFRDRVVAVSDELKNFLIKEIGIKYGKVIRIYNSVDVSEHNINVKKDALKDQLGIPSGIKIIGIVARLAPVKDHKTLFLAFKKVRQDFADVRLLVVGGGPLGNSLKEFVTEIGEKDSIIFLGERQDTKELLHVMDMVCLSSVSEGLSLTLTEAMASGKPIVATDVGGNSELVINGITGLLVPPRDPDRMAEAIIELLKDDEMRKSMGGKARKRVEENFNIRNTVRQYEDLYFDLAKQKGIVS